MKENILVSIVMATYNSEKYIDETILSIQAQLHEHWELIITDDCSSDSTLRILEKYSNSDSRISFFKNGVNSGAAVTRNNSIAKCSGSYIAFLDSDDLWHESKLQSHLGFMESNNLALSFTSYELIDEHGRELNKRVDVNSPLTVTYEDMLCKRATFGCSTVMLNNTLVGAFSMPLLRTGQDYATWLMLLKRVGEAHLYPETLTKYRICPNSISRNKFKKSKRQWQIYRDVEKLSLFKSTYCFCNYAWRAVFRS